MPKFLTADNLDEYAEGRLPQKNHRKNRLNFIRQEVSKGHLKTASQKSKKGNKKQSVSDGFKLDDVASWLQKRRGIKLERPDLIEVENIHDVFSSFIEMH